MALRRVFNWTVVDVVDGRAHMLEKSPKLPLVVGRNGTLLTTAMEEVGDEEGMVGISRSDCFSSKQAELNLSKQP